jgi:pentatricopeptide repeat protein
VCLWHLVLHHALHPWTWTCFPCLSCHAPRLTFWSLLRPLACPLQRHGCALPQIHCHSSACLHLPFRRHTDRPLSCRIWTAATPRNGNWSSPWMAVARMMTTLMSLTANSRLVVDARLHRPPLEMFLTTAAQVEVQCLTRSFPTAATQSHRQHAQRLHSQICRFALQSCTVSLGMWQWLDIDWSVALGCLCASSHHVLPALLCAKNAKCKQELPSITGLRARELNAAPSSQQSSDRMLEELLALGAQPSRQAVLNVIRPACGAWGANPRALTQCLRSLGKAHCSQTAVLVVRALEEAGVDINVYHYGSAISTCQANGQWQLALSVIALMSEVKAEANTITYNAAISACEKASQWQATSDMLSAMLEASIERDVATYSHQCVFKGRQLARRTAPICRDAPMQSPA